MKFFLSKYLKLMVILVFVFGLIQCGNTKNAASAKDSRLWEYKTKFDNFYSWESEIKMGADVQKKQIEASEQNKIPVDPKDKEKLRLRIERIAKRILAVSDYPNLPLEVHLYDDPKTANAFCLPGGKIGFFTGIFDPEIGMLRQESDDEIAAVVGHEIAHATLRHSTRQMSTYFKVSLVSAVVGLILDVQGGDDVLGPLGLAFNVASLFYFPSYSRKHETEADKIGFYYLAKAGYDPKAAIAIWERMDMKKTKEGREASSFFSSHPSSHNRAEFLKGYLPDAESVRQNKELVF